MKHCTVRGDVLSCVTIESVLLEQHPRGTACVTTAKGK